jgi:hypothetical protein
VISEVADSSFRIAAFMFPEHSIIKKVKLSRYTPWRHMGEKEV